MISFPLLLDRDVGAVEAVLTSVRVVATNPLMMAIWGLIVAGSAVDRLLAVVLRVGRGGAGARAFDLAPLSQGGRAGSKPSPGTPTAGEKPPLRGAISGRSVHRRTRQPFERCGEALEPGRLNRRTSAPGDAAGAARGFTPERSRPTRPTRKHASPAAGAGCHAPAHSRPPAALHSPRTSPPRYGCRD